MEFRLKKLSFLFIAMFSFKVFSQEINLETSQDYNDHNLARCQRNQLHILKLHEEQFESELKRLVTGMYLEFSKGNEANQSKLSEMKTYFTEVLIKKEFILVLSKKLKSVKDIDGFYLDDANKNKLILNADNMEIVVENAGKKIASYKNDHRYAEHIWKRLIGDLEKDVAKNLSIYAVKNAVGKLIIKGILPKILLSGQRLQSLKSFVIKMGPEILTGIAKGLLIDVLTTPLLTHRPASEYEWSYELLQKYPSFIINPEWMLEANIGKDVNPWFTHDNALQRHTKLMKKIIKKSLDSEEKQFQLKAQHFETELVQYNENAIQRDGTSIMVRPNVIIDWAIKSEGK